MPKYRLIGHARHKGAIGRFQRFDLTIEADNAEAALAKSYDHIDGWYTTPIITKEEPREETFHSNS